MNLANQAHSATILRQAIRADVPAIQRVRHSVKENQLTSTVIHDDDVIDAIERTGRGWVVEANGQIAGFAIGNRETGNIWALFVDPAYEGQGFGRRLHDAMLNWLAASGVDSVFLSTEAHTRAQSFYAAAGWTEVGTLPDGEVRFERRLGPESVPT